MRRSAVHPWKPHARHQGPSRARCFHQSQETHYHQVATDHRAKAPRAQKFASHSETCHDSNQSRAPASDHHQAFIQHAAARSCDPSTQAFPTNDPQVTAHSVEAETRDHGQVHALQGSSAQTRCTNSRRQSRCSARGLLRSSLMRDCCPLDRARMLRG